jgi:hypothetical protein
VGESSEWTAIVNSAEENRATFVMDGEPLFNVLYCRYMLTVNELKNMSVCQ